MGTLIEALRQIIGEPEFYITNGSYSGSWNYGAMIEYMIAGLIVLVCVASVFKFILNLTK